MPSIRLPVQMNEPMRFEARVEILSPADMPPPEATFGTQRPELPRPIKKTKREECLEGDGIRLKPPQNQDPPRQTGRGLLLKITPWFDSLKRKERSS